MLGQPDPVGRAPEAILLAGHGCRVHDEDHRVTTPRPDPAGGVSVLPEVNLVTPRGTSPVAGTEATFRRGVP